MVGLYDLRLESADGEIKTCERSSEFAGRLGTRELFV